jgi:hypothetical protein
MNALEVCPDDFFHLSRANLPCWAPWRGTILLIDDAQHLPSQFLFGFILQIGTEDI